MTERYDELRRPFDLDEGREETPETPPWAASELDTTPAYAAESLVEEERRAAIVEPAPAPQRAPEPEPVPEPVAEPRPVAEHAPAGFDIPHGYRTLEGEAVGAQRSVAVVVSRFNGEITSQLLSRALEQLGEAGVMRDSTTIVPVPGAFELPLAAMALAKTRRYACVIALGCVIRGETPHFDYVASEAASGLQLAALETGTPVSFGVLTCDTRAQAEARLDRARDAVRTALEMADVFSQLRAAAAR